MKGINVCGLLLVTGDEGFEVRAGLSLDLLADEDGAGLAAAALDFESGSDQGACFDQLRSETWAQEV